jgi:hypothetical protein
MAEALVMRPDIVQANPGHPGNWEPGMIVEVFEDGMVGPGNEQHPRFWVMRLPNITVAEAVDLWQALYDTTDPENPVLTRRRGKRVVFASLPQPMQNQINNDNDRDVTSAATYEQLLGWIEDLGPV